MSSFDGRLHMPGYSKIPLGVEVDITHERMTLTSGQRRIGAWSLNEVGITSMSDGFHIKLDDEEVVLSVFESDRFVSELGPAVRHPAPTVMAPRPTTKAAPSISQPKRPGLETPTARFDDLERRISDLSVAVTMDSIAPSEVFGRWLRLLKEINDHHGEGAMPTDLFYQLNTELLELIPEPSQAELVER